MRSPVIPRIALAVIASLLLGAGHAEARTHEQRRSPFTEFANTARQSPYNAVLANDGRRVVMGATDDDYGNNARPRALILDTKTGEQTKITLPDNCAPARENLVSGLLALLRCGDAYAVYDFATRSLRWGPQLLPASSTENPGRPRRFGSWWLTYDFDDLALIWHTGEIKPTPYSADLNTPDLDPPKRPCAPWQRTSEITFPGSRFGKWLLIRAHERIYVGRCGGPKKLRPIADGPAWSSASIAGGWTAWMARRECSPWLRSRAIPAGKVTRWPLPVGGCITGLDQTAYGIVVSTRAPSDQPYDTRYFWAKRPR
jgi:hypothetical protein